MMTRLTFARTACLAAACFVGTAALAGHSRAQQTPAAATPVAVGPAVKIENFTFNPPEITINAGTTVTWTNADDIPHTVNASDKAFHSGPLDTDQTFAFTFAKPGTYEYFCALHPHMTGKVVVK